MNTTCYHSSSMPLNHLCSFVSPLKSYSHILSSTVSLIITHQASTCTSFTNLSSLSFPTTLTENYFNTQITYHWIGALWSLTITKTEVVLITTALNPVYLSILFSIVYLRNVLVLTRLSVLSLLVIITSYYVEMLLISCNYSLSTSVTHLLSFVFLNLVTFLCHEMMQTCLIQDSFSLLTTLTSYHSLTWWFWVAMKPLSLHWFKLLT
jgi:hypothetical protein